MTTNIAKTQDIAVVSGESPKRANVRARKPRVARTKGKVANKAPKAATRAKSTARAREGSKTAKILDLLRRPGGATLKELIKATGWQPHSVRGFLSGAIGKKMGLTINSAKSEDGDRRYSVAE